MFGKGRKTRRMESCFRTLFVGFDNLERFCVHFRYEFNACEAGVGFETENIVVETTRKALRVIPRGKHRLTVYRAHQAFL